MVFFAFSYSLIYNNRISKNVVWIAALLGVFLGCYFRTLSGKHFPTDVIVGGLVGSLVAVGILKLHISKRIELE
ncbi:phosphatase PAP2 family protein [Maribacter halichondriae]|uniref:phosphatase PAP2 family protein n=1 Tax=Maribacter halichondriae TaxID=2980554 RepID=UPI003D31AD81